MDSQPQPSPPPAPSDAPTTLPFGPFAGRDVAYVAVADPGYLLDLVRERVGSDILRAEAARALAMRARLVPIGEPWPGGAGPVGALMPPEPLASSAPSGAARWASHAGSPHALETRRDAGLVAAARAVARWLAAARPWQVALIAAAAIAVVIVIAGHRPPGATRLDAANSLVEAPRSAIVLPTSFAAAVPDREASRAASGNGGSGSNGPGKNNVGATPALPAAAAGPPPPCGARVPGAIPAESAADYLDTFQAVEFEVVQGKDTGKVTFLNSAIPYAGTFYVAIFPDDYAAFPEPPAIYLAGRCIVVQGTIELYRGAPQIVLRHPDDLRIVGDAVSSASDGRAPPTPSIADQQPTKTRGQ